MGNQLLVETSDGARRGLPVCEPGIVGQEEFPQRKAGGDIAVAKYGSRYRGSQPATDIHLGQGLFYHY